jgi:6-phosphogluconolactonase (cycloisomerase 2 family)
MGTTAPARERNAGGFVFNARRHFCIHDPSGGAPLIHRRPKKRSIVFCGIETLESRRLMSATPPSVRAASFIYTETDNSNPGQNAVIGYRQDADGRVTQIGSFKTDGTGLANPQGLLGPDDSDKEVIASPDGRFVFAVNQGSNSVAVFRVHHDGALELVHHAAFDSGGTEPVSLAIAGGRLYVVNRGDEVQGQSGTIAPTITVFNIGRNGELHQDFAATTTLPLGLSPSQILISSTGHLAFVDTFTPPPLNNVAEANEVVPFQIAADGKLIPVSSGGIGASVTPPLLLGLAQNPTRDIIYAGLTGAAKVGVLTFDHTGNLEFVDQVSVQGAGPCWILVSPNGKFLYSVDTGTNSVGVFSLSDPLHPVQIQEFVLGGPQNPTGDPTAPRETTAFEFAFDPSGNRLFVIDHQTDAAGNFPQGNALHVLDVAPDGTLSESASSPLFLPSDIPAGADPQGVAVIAAGRSGDNR